MRAQATQAFARLSVSSRMRRLMLRNIPTQREFWPGQLVYFYTEARRRSRNVPDGKRWRGPATVLAREGERRYYVSWRSRLLLCAGEQLRLASVRETRMHQVISDSSLRESLAPNRVAGAIDVRPTREGERVDHVEDTPVPPQIEVILPTRILPEQGAQERPRGSIRRPLPEMTRINALRRLRARRQDQPETRLTAVKRRRSIEPEQEGAMQPQVSGEPATSRVRHQEPPQEEETHDRDDEHFWREVGEVEDEYQRERPPPMRGAESASASTAWHDDFTDVPWQFRQQVESSASHAAYAGVVGADTTSVDWTGQCKELESRLNACVDESLVSLLHILLSSVKSGSNEETGKDRWVTRNELRMLRKMLHFPLSCVRVHGVRRKQWCRTSKGEHVRLTLCLHDDGWKVHIHTSEDMSSGSKNKTKRPWYGLSGFFKVNPDSKSVCVQMPDGELAEVNLEGTSSEVYQVFKAWQSEHDAYVLSMKASGKELDPTKFDLEESQAFEEADRVEWRSWIKNGVVRIVPPHEMSSIPRSRIFPVPARMIRVNKDKSGGLTAKSRMVIPGHLDPSLGEARTDAPTVASEVICMMISIAAQREWGIVTFDVTTAFLQGNPTSRDIYIRTPKQALPALPDYDLPAVPACTLLKVLKSAYGLSEAPRLWFLRAHEALLEVGFKAVEAAPCCYRWTQGSEIIALLSLHVDDGLVIADLDSALWKSIQDKVSQAFTIKAWVKVTEQPLEHLGMELSRTSEGYQLNMAHYALNKIETVPARRKKGMNPEQLLDDKDKLAFRSLLAKVAWPARKVGLAFAYRCSKLASASNKATYADQASLWALTKEMQEAARKGEMKLCYKRDQRKGDMQLVACHDASFAREPGGKSQEGYIIGLAPVAIDKGPAHFHLVAFSTHRIKRVVKSTMAAESASVAEAADMMQYLLVLYRQMTEGEWTPGRDWQAALADQANPGVLVIDGKSLYDHLSTTGNIPSEKQILLDLLYVKQQ
eukprot:6492490-Amphidinium_carterae.1